MTHLTALEQQREDQALGAAYRRCAAALDASGRSFLRLTRHTPTYFWAACNWIGELAEDASGSTPTEALEALADALEDRRTQDHIDRLRAKAARKTAE